jgi:hypothetical protein
LLGVWLLLATRLAGTLGIFLAAAISLVKVKGHPLTAHADLVAEMMLVLRCTDFG